MWRKSQNRSPRLAITATAQEVAIVYGRFRLAREAGHGLDCATIYARSALDHERPSLSILAHCVCGLRARLLAERDPLATAAAPEQLTPAERAERRHRHVMARPATRTLRAG